MKTATTNGILTRIRLYQYMIENKTASTWHLSWGNATRYPYQLIRVTRTWCYLTIKWKIICPIRLPSAWNCRIGGRLGGGTFEMGGKTYKVDTNEGKDTNLHGGPHGFNTVNWDGEIDDSDENEAKIILSHTFKSSDDSFPGDMTAKMIYSLDNNDRVNLKFESNSTALTLFNPTLHVYFNLSDDQLISGQTLQINAKEHLEVTSEKIPTGNFIQNAGTPFDFSNVKTWAKPSVVCKDYEKGFDDLFHVEPGEDNTIAELSDPQSNRSVTIKSSRNGLVVFTANSFTSDMKLATGAGQPYMGVALEAQTLSDTPHHPNFGDVSVPAGETKTYQISYEVKY